MLLERAMPAMFYQYQKEKIAGMARSYSPIVVSSSRLRCGLVRCSQR